MDKLTNLQELLKHELKDVYSAEAQIIKALPAMIEKAKHPKLKKSLKDHLKITELQKKRLYKVQQLLDTENIPNGNKGFFANLFKSDEGEEHCKAMEGLIKEGEKMMGEDMTPEVMDAAIIAAAQKIEHYEISSYGTARCFALMLGLKNVARMLEETLNEEYFADNSLTDLALAEVNVDAKAGSKGSIPGKKTAAKKAAPKKSAPAKKAAGKKVSKTASAKKTAARPAPAKKTAAKTGRKKSR